MKKIIFITFLNLLLLLNSCSNKASSKKSFVFRFGAIVSGVALNGGIFVKATSVDKNLLVKLGPDNTYEFPNGSWNFEIVAFEGPIQFSGRKFCGNIANINLTGSDESISVEARENTCGASQFQDLVAEINLKFGLSNVALTNVKIENNQLVITGSNLSGITGINFSNSNINQNLTIASQSSSQIIADFTSNVSLGAGKIFNLMLSDAMATGAFTVDFSLCNSSLFGHGINCSSVPNDRDVLSFDSTSGKWLSRSIDGLAYQGVWSPLSGTYPIATSPGDYYIITTAGTFNSVTYQVGDWINYNGSTFDKVPRAQNKTSVYGRPGVIVGQKGDYNLNKMSDVDLTTTVPANGDVLKFDGTNWIPSAIGGGGSVTSVNGQNGAVVLTSSNIAEGSNLYFTAPRVLSTTITTPSFINSPISGTDTILASLGKLQGQINNNSFSAGTASQYLRGDKTWQNLDTNNVVEATNLYFTNARVLGVTLAGFAIGSNSVVNAADTIVSATGKLQAQIQNQTTTKADLTNMAQTITASTVTGLSAPVATTDAVNKSYVDSIIASVVLKNGNSGAYNLSVGSNSMAGATGSSFQNTGIGNNSLTALSTGTNNTGIGYATLASVTTGVGNTALGYAALNYATGSGNIAIGQSAGYSITTGSNNVIIGGNSGSSIATSSNNILLADGSGTTRMVVNQSGYVGFGTTSPTGTFQVVGDTVGTGNGSNISMTAQNASAGYGGNIILTAGVGSTTYKGNIALGTSTFASNALQSYSIGNSTNIGTTCLNCFVVGSSSSVNSNGGIAIGNPATSTGNYAVSIGSNAYTSGSSSLALGASTTVAGTNASAVGYGTTSPTYATMAIGTYNVGIAGTSGSWVTSDPLLEVGNGTGSGARSNAMTIFKNGNVGIGTIAPAYTLHVNGSVAGTSAFVTASDERYKKDIEVIPNALEKILKLNGVTYNWRQNEFPEKKFSGRTELGVIAQNVEKIFPEAVSTDREGFRSVAYTMLISPLIEAVKELNQKIIGIFKLLQTKAEVTEVKKLEVENASLKKKNAQIENELSDLKNRMNRLEKLLQK